MELSWIIHDIYLGSRPLGRFLIFLVNGTIFKMAAISQNSGFYVKAKLRLNPSGIPLFRSNAITLYAIQIAFIESPIPY